MPLDTLIKFESHYSQIVSNPINIKALVTYAMHGPVVT